MREQTMNTAVGVGGAGLHPEVLWWTAFLIRTGAAPPGPARGTASACEPRVGLGGWGWGQSLDANSLPCTRTHECLFFPRLLFLTIKQMLFCPAKSHCMTFQRESAVSD